jgi:hypothetical protein
MAEHSEIRIYDGGGMSLIGPDAVELYRAATLRMSISLHQKCGMIPTRGVTITKMFTMVHRYSGKRYKRGAHDAALADLDVWIATMKAALPVVDERKAS